MCCEQLRTVAKSRRFVGTDRAKWTIDLCDWHDAIRQLSKKSALAKAKAGKKIAFNQCPNPAGTK
jgi:hypothetical protein